MPDNDMEKAIAERIRTAAAQGLPLVVRGGGSKEFLGRRIGGEILDVSSLRGIVHYEPTELVITARAGTPLAEIEAALAERGQMLGFEPPHYGATATLGGTVACGLSGPARPFRGAARDFVLGVQLVNGRGEILRFGGEVMKNVAGYDVSRLMCGAYGTLGVLLEVSLKVLPRPDHELSLALEADAEEARERMAAWQREPLPLSALGYDGDRLHVRLSGAEAAVAAARRRLGGEIDSEGDAFWTRLREQRGAFFEGKGELWRLSLPATAAAPAIAGKHLCDWGGALRWFKTGQDAAGIFAAALAAGGHATRWRGNADAQQVFQPLPGPLLALHRRLRHAFDPRGVLNPGRLYPEL
jgi:glycolate oxidase FAD binding subunit